MKVTNLNDAWATEQIAHPEMKSSELNTEVRRKFEAASDTNFVVFHGVSYDTKMDRYVANFGTLGTNRKFIAKCSPAVAKFLMSCSDVHGSWYLKIDDNGVIIDANVLRY